MQKQANLFCKELLYNCHAAIPASREAEDPPLQPQFGCRARSLWVVTKAGMDVSGIKRNLMSLSEIESGPSPKYRSSNL